MTEIKKSEFGSLKTGEKVFKYTLKNELLEIGILNYGGIITQIIMSDKEGNKENVVLGYNNILDYEEKSPYFGAITGRVAGRIEGGSFVIGGKKYTLEKNNGNNNLHGGIIGLDKRIWEVEVGEDRIIMSYESPHLEEGFPGNIKFKVEYILKNNTLEIVYLGIPDMETIINLTNHTYFNLSGNCKENILEHILYINSDKVPYLDTESIPHGEYFDVTNTPFDFRKPKKIGKEIKTENIQLKQARGYDHPWILNKEKKLEISLFHEKTGRKVEVYTDREAVVVYTGNFLGEEEGVLSCGVKVEPHLGVCLETQELPNNINVKEFKSSIYTKNNPYSAKTKYKFIIEE